MGLQDRDYMRRQSPPAGPPARPSHAWRQYLWSAVGLIALVGAGIYVAREVRADSTPEQGDLIVNVNTATLQELETIPGIGKILAQRIVAKRPYKRVEDLLRVNGIAEVTLNNIRPYVKVEGETEER